MTVLKKYRFQFHWLKRGRRERIDRVCKLAGKKLGRRFYLVRSLFGRIFLCAVGDLDIIPLLSNRRPPDRAMVAIVGKEQTILMPTANREDYDLLADYLNVSTEQEALLYHLIVNYNFAVVDKHSLPIQIQSDDDAQRHGFRLRSTELDVLRQGGSLWWQKWGGVLIGCEFTSDPPRVASIESVRQGAGELHRVPASVVR